MIFGFKIDRMSLKLLLIILINIALKIFNVNSQSISQVNIIDELFIGLYSVSPITFHDANNECNTRYGTTLASIHSSDENIDAFSSINSNEGWIGFNDEDIEGTFVWNDETNVDYTNWRINQPNNIGGSQNCAAFFDSSSSDPGQWHDWYCDDLSIYYFVCNHPLNCLVFVLSFYAS